MNQHAEHLGPSQPPPSPPASLILIGMRGAGKTTTGKLLAGRLNIPFFDTDEIITAQTGRTIADIFAAEGESGFRRREAEAIRHATGQTPAVISVGGGAVLDPANVTRLRTTGRMIWLSAPAEVLWQRVSSDQATVTSRPSLTTHHGRDEIAKLLTARKPLYQSAADMTIDTENRSPHEVVELILERMTNTEC